MKDGRLLKPSRPAMSINSTFQQRCFDKYGPSGYVWATFTEVSEPLVVYISYFRAWSCMCIVTHATVVTSI